MSINLKNDNQGHVKTNIERPDSNQIKLINKTYTALVSDLLGKNVSLDNKIKPLKSGMRLCGPAITISGKDLTVRRAAINLAKPGDVLIISSDVYHEIACFGDGTALKMKLKGLGGIVIDGYVRDSLGISELGFPTFCTGTTVRNFHYPIDQEYGSINYDIVCGGKLISPGDIIFGDDDGVIVIEKSKVPSISKLATEIFNSEKIERDISSFNRFEGVEETLLDKGYIFD